MRTKGSNNARQHIATVYRRAREADPESAFGGIVALSQTVDAAALRRGVPLAISSPGAFFKVSPAARDLRIITPDGHTLRPCAGLRPIGSDPLAFTLDPAAGTGLFTLRAEADAPIHIDVLERGSEFVLLVQAARDVVFVGEQIHLEARLLHRGRPVPVERLHARLVAPNGHTLTRSLARQRDGGYIATLPVQGEPDARPWSIEVELDATVAGRTVRRTATTAVAVSAPTARLTGTAVVTHPGEGVRAEFALDVASDSRYALSAVLHGHNREPPLRISAPEHSMIRSATSEGSQAGPVSGAARYSLGKASTWD